MAGLGGWVAGLAGLAGWLVGWLVGWLAGWLVGMGWYIGFDPIIGDQGPIGPYYPSPSEFTHHLQNLPTTFRIYPPLQNLPYGAL